MKKILIVAESGSDITVEMAKEYDITIVPMHVSFGDETVDDGTFPVEDIVKYYRESGKLPKTSAATPGDFEIVFDALHEEYPEAHILYLAYSAITTCSYQSAMIAAVNREYITLLDTKQVSFGFGSIVLEVARALKENENLTINELVDFANQKIATSHMCFLPDDLEFLRAGGRVSNVAYMGAKLFNLHPVIEIIEGKLVATKKYRGKMSRVAAKMVKEYSDLYNLDKRCIWIVYTVGLSDEVKMSIEEAVTECGYASMVWTQANGVITVHGGPGAVGIAGFKCVKE